MAGQVKHRGFTLIELLLVAAIAALVATVVLGGFAAGIRVWERARSFSGPESSCRIALDLIRKDLCNLAPNRKFVFKGGRDWLEIPSIVGMGSNAWPGMIRYECDRDRLYRVAHSLDSSGRALEAREMLLSGMRAGDFSYADAGLDGLGAPAWTRDWVDRTNLPVAVGLKFSVPAGKDNREIQGTILLPRRYSMREREERR